MRLSCSQKDLSSALMISSKAVDLNSTLPVLNNVLIKAEGKKLYFTTTNLEIAINYHIEADIKNEGEITIPSKLFTSYINYLKDEKVDIEVEEGGSVLVKTSDSKTKIKGLPSSEFPPIPTVEKEGVVTVDSTDLKRAINQVVFAASLNTTRPILAGIYFVIDGKNLKMVATDSYRLAEKEVPVKKSEGEVDCIIPAKTINEIGSILDSLKKETEVQIQISKNQVLFTINEVQVTSRLIEGKFPNYKQIIPESSKTKVNFDVNELSLVLKRINIFAKENNNKVLFKVSDKSVQVTTESTQLGEGVVEIATKIEGEANEVAINSQYLLDVLSNIGTDQIVFEMGEKIAPTIVKPASKTDYIHIIMPLKI